MYQVKSINLLDGTKPSYLFEKFIHSIIYRIFNSILTEGDALSSKGLMNLINPLNIEFIYNNLSTFGDVERQKYPSRSPIIKIMIICTLKDVEDLKEAHTHAEKIKKHYDDYFMSTHFNNTVNNIITNYYYYIGQMKGKHIQCFKPHFEIDFNFY